MSDRDRSGDRDRDRGRRDGDRRDSDKDRKRRDRSESESGTPDWLKTRRKKQANGELPRGERSGGGDFGGGGGKGDKGGGFGGGGGKGEQRPGDWACPSCGMNNFARRTECFKCGTPKGNDDRGGGRDRYRSRSRRR